MTLNYKSLGLITILSIAFSLGSMAHARLMITSQIDTGTILSIDRDKAIELNGSYTYHPFNKNIELNVQSGDMVTIEYYIDSEGVRKYLAVSLGQFTLDPKLPPREPVKEPVY